MIDPRAASYRRVRRSQGALLFVGMALFLGGPVDAATLRVWSGSPAPAVPYATWETAARTIQDAVEAATEGATILVTNGVYRTGVGSIEWGEEARVVTHAPILLRSVNGPADTVIDGGNEMRCVVLAPGGVLDGFTLTRGRGRVEPEMGMMENGGGLWVPGGGGRVTNCVFLGNSAWNGGGAAAVSVPEEQPPTSFWNCVFRDNTATGRGGAVLGCVLYNSVLIGNRAGEAGGGAAGCELSQCLVVDNAAGVQEGGVSEGPLCGGNLRTRVRNSIVYANRAFRWPNHGNIEMAFSCASPVPSGPGNVDVEPELASLTHLAPESPLVAAGDPGHAFGVDLDGDPWRDPPPMGADQPRPIGALQVAITTEAQRFGRDYLATFQADIAGAPARSVWDFGDGVLVTNRPIVRHGWSEPGTHTVRLTAWNESHPEGVSAVVEVLCVEADHFADPSNPNPVPPYRSWATAANRLEDAVRAAGDTLGGTVWATHGVYRLGETAEDGLNRVALTRGVRLLSVGGPDVTTIEGADPGVRCARVGPGSMLAGFTLTGGRAVYGAGSGLFPSEDGGAVFCDPQGVVSNCVLRANRAEGRGGGAYGGRLRRCVVEKNEAIFGGGADGAVLEDCVLRGNRATEYGGGAREASLVRCVLTNNEAAAGGGLAESTAEFCELRGNRAGSEGGGAFGGRLANCTVAGNEASLGGGSFSVLALNSVIAGNRGGGTASGTNVNCTIVGNEAQIHGGVRDCRLYNCIVWGNRAAIHPNRDELSTFESSCTSPLPPGPGNVDIDPALASVSHLSVDSPCARAGSRAWASGSDIDGEPWAQPPAMGADQPGPVSAAEAGVRIEASVARCATGYAASFEAWSVGPLRSSVWDFGDGTRVTNVAYVTHAWERPGEYQVRLVGFDETHPGGVGVSVPVTVVESRSYVDPESRNPVAPFASWETAARTIPEALAAMDVPGGTVWVADGVYRTGVMERDGPNRVVLTGGLRLKSVHGPWRTVIDGGPDGVRCAWVDDGAILDGFTLTGGVATARWAGDIRGYGGGVLGASWRAVVTHCVVRGNAAWNGGGVAKATMERCVVSGNLAEVDGGATLALLRHCTVSGNEGVRGAGGVNGGGLDHCVVWSNRSTAGEFDNHGPGGVVAEYTCSAPLLPGPGNLDADPRLITASHLDPRSPCVGAGREASGVGADIDGDPWSVTPALGVDEPTAAGPLQMAVAAAEVRVATGFPVALRSDNLGGIVRAVWDFGDGSSATNQAFVRHSWSEPGRHRVVLTGYSDDHPDGVSASVEVEVVAVTHHVDAKSSRPVPPYSSWETAAVRIQDAIDVAEVPGARIWVAEGTYADGGREKNGASRVVLDRRVLVTSVRGPALTVIQGGEPLVRGAWVGSGSVLSGFTVTGGKAGVGGGVYGETFDAVVSNCVLRANTAKHQGGGARGGTLLRCVVEENRVFGEFQWDLYPIGGGGTWGSRVDDSRVAGNVASSGPGVSGVGGGACEGLLRRCTVSGNRAISGGGAYTSTLEDCLLTENQASYGGGAHGGVLRRCRVLGNTATGGPGGAGYSRLEYCLVASNRSDSISSAGGTDFGVLSRCTVTANRGEWGGGVLGGEIDHCIVRFNVGRGFRDYAPSGVEGRMTYSCATPQPPGPGNIDVDPGFVDAAGGDYRLRAGSLCVDAGDSVPVSGSVDLRGDPAWVDGNGDGAVRADLGAYEYQPPPRPFFSRIERIPGGLLLEWDPQWLGARVEVSDRLPATAWQPVPGSTVTHVLTLPLEPGSRFYRLVLP